MQSIMYATRTNERGMPRVVFRVRFEEKDAAFEKREETAVSRTTVANTKDENVIRWDADGFLLAMTLAKQ